MRQPLFVAALAALVVAPASAQPDHVAKVQVKVREAWAARYQDSRHGPEITDRFTRTVKIGATGSLDLTNVAGDITVTGGSGDSVRIDAVKRVRSRDEADAKALLDELRIEVVELPNRLEVRTVYPRNRRNYHGTVEYNVTVPTGVRASIKSVSGDVRVTNVKGEVRAESVSGDVVTSGASRLSVVKSVSGDIQVTDAAADGVVSVSTVSGSLTARGLKAQAVDFSSVSGDVTIMNVTCDRANVKSVSGSVEYMGPLARSGRYEMNTHSGTVRLAISGTSGFELEATTFSGDVRSDFPLTLRTGAEGGDRRGRRMNRSIRGSYGDAGAIVSLQSFSGDIVVTKAR